MLRRLKSSLQVASRAIRPLSLYSHRSLTDSESTDHDSVCSEPSTIHSSFNCDIPSPVSFGPAPYEVASVGPAIVWPETEYNTVEYCSDYDIFEEYGFADIFEQFNCDRPKVCGVVGQSLDS